MRKSSLWFWALAALLGSGLYAQDIAGDWQGTLKAGPQDLRLILKIEKADGGGWKGSMYSIDQTTDAIPVTSVTLADSNLEFTVDAVRGSYEGKVSADGASIGGTWTQGAPLPLELQRTTKETAWQIDPAKHSVQFITVDKDVKLEVLDWGGTGRPVVLLTGLGNNAHVFDKFASKLTPSYHVYGITRRGFGVSSSPDASITANYSADRLGDDVLAVLDALKINRPIVVGHSIGGEELSSVGSRHPEKVAGLIYLDAGYGYAYYDRSRGDLTIDVIELQKKLQQLQPGNQPRDPKPLVQELLETSLPGLEKDLREFQKNLQDQPPPTGPAPPQPAGPTAGSAIIAGQQKYTDIKVPILAIFAVPHDPGPQISNDPKARAAFEARDEASTGAQAKAFESGLPSARVVRLPHANHYVFLSNEADVLREMNAFIGTLP
jgi:non-heme chloroperoxidase